MTLADSYRLVLVPANTAVSALRRAGLTIDADRVRAQREAWETELRDLERQV